MNNNFAHNLAIEGKFEQLEKIREKLKTIGYADGSAFEMNYRENDFLIVEPKGRLQYNLLGDSNRAKLYGSMLLPAEEEDAILAIASMRRGPVFHEGEYVTWTDDYGKYSTGDIMWFGKGDVAKIIKSLWDGNSITLFSDRYNTKGSFGISKIRKSTPEEIREYFCKKKEVVKPSLAKVQEPKEEKEKFPTKWVIRRTKQNAKILNKWFNKKYDADGFRAENKYLMFPKQNGTNVCHEPKSGYTLITTEQFTKHILKDSSMDKKIIGYRLTKPEYTQAACTIDGYIGIGESIKEGALIPLNSIHKEKAIEKLRTAGVLDLWFEPVYADEWKTGDYAVYEGGAQYTAKKPGHVFIVEKISDTAGETFLYEGIANNIQARFCRKATEAEISNYENVQIAGYVSVVDDSSASFGCVVVSRQDLIAIRTLLRNDEAQAILTVRGEQITIDHLNKLIRKIEKINKAKA